MSELLKELVQREQAANMYQRFAKAKAKCAVMQKRGFNDFNKYNYVMESDVVSLVNEACSEQGLIWVCSYFDFKDSIFTSDKGKTHIRTSCRCELQVIDSESGQVIVKTENDSPSGIRCVTGEHYWGYGDVSAVTQSVRKKRMPASAI